MDSNTILNNIPMYASAFQRPGGRWLQTWTDRATTERIPLIIFILVPPLPPTTCNPTWAWHLCSLVFSRYLMRVMWPSLVTYLVSQDTQSSKMPSEIQYLKGQRYTRSRLLWLSVHVWSNNLKATNHSDFTGVFIAAGEVGPCPVAVGMQEPMAGVGADLCDHLCK